MSVHRWAFFVWQAPMSRGTKSTRWPSEPVEQNMTSDLAAVSLMAYRNSLKFMTRAHMQVSKTSACFYSSTVMCTCDQTPLQYISLHIFKSFLSHRTFIVFWVLVLTLCQTVWILSMHKYRSLSCNKNTPFCIVSAIIKTTLRNNFMLLFFRPF